MIRIFFIVIAVAGLLFSEYKYSLTDIESSPTDQLPVKILSFRTASGWGYEINVDGKTFIHQDVIPAVQGSKSFQSPEDAIKVGTYVMEKMKNKKRPTITVDELRQLNIKDL